MPARRLQAEAGASLENVGKAMALVVAAGLCTAVGACAVFQKRIVQLSSKPVLAIGLSVAGGVMIYASFMDIFVKSFDAFEAEGFGTADAYLLATLCLFGGMLLLRLLTFVAHKLDPRSVLEEEVAPTGAVGAVGEGLEPGDHAAGAERAAGAVPEEKAARRRLKRLGLNTALAIGIHNAPEGLATFVGYLSQETVGVTLAVAIGFHNIPEGFCVALPVFYATGSRWQGFGWALLSGAAEPVGALIGWGIVASTGEDMQAVVYAVLFGVVAGMMVEITILELIPTAVRLDPGDRFVSTSVVVGMAIMAASLVLLKF